MIFQNRESSYLMQLGYYRYVGKRTCSLGSLARLLKFAVNATSPRSRVHLAEFRADKDCLGPHFVTTGYQILHIYVFILMHHCKPQLRRFLFLRV